MTKYGWIVAIVLAVACKGKGEPPPRDPPSPSPVTPPKSDPVAAPTVEQRATLAIKSYFEILAAFTRAFDAGSGCDDKRQRVAAMFADATTKRDDLAAMFRDLEVVKHAGPTMVRPSEDDPNYDVRMNALGIVTRGFNAACNLDGDLNTFLLPIWQAADDVGWTYDDDARSKELLEAKRNRPVTMIWKDVPSLGVKISVPDDVSMVSVDANQGGGLHYGSPEEDRARVFHFSLYPANRRAASAGERKQAYAKLPGFKAFTVERVDGDTWHLEVAHEDVKDHTAYVSFSIRIATGGALIDCESTERAPEVAARIVAACKTIQPMR